MNAQIQFDISVLHVEDEDFTREEIHQLLRGRYRKVFVAQNGTRGLESYGESYGVKSHLLTDLSLNEI